MNINKLLKDWPRLLERIEALERQINSRIIASPFDGKPIDLSKFDTGTQVPVTLAPAVSERSPAVTKGAGIGEERTRNKRGSTRRN